MTCDVMQLQCFYKTALGEIVRLEIEKILHKLSPSSDLGNTIGIGYCDPFFPFFDMRKGTYFFFVPAQQGVISLNEDKISENRKGLVIEEQLPLPDRCIQTAILIHSFEHSPHPHKFLEELYRVLAPSGRIVLIVPNRRSLWAQSEHTPFGTGCPYTKTQLSHILTAHQFLPIAHTRGLYLPPFKSCGSVTRFIFKHIAPHVMGKISGVIGMTAIKQTHASIATTRAQDIKALALNRLRNQPVCPSESSNTLG